MEKDNTKTSRANQTRTKSERPKVWVPPSSLDAPPAPDGFRYSCLLYTSPSPRDAHESRMPSSA